MIWMIWMSFMILHTRCNCTDLVVRSVLFPSAQMCRSAQATEVQFILLRSRSKSTMGPAVHRRKHKARHKHRLHLASSSQGRVPMVAVEGNYKPSRVVD